VETIQYVDSSSPNRLWSATTNRSTAPRAVSPATTRAPAVHALARPAGRSSPTRAGSATVVACDAEVTIRADPTARFSAVSTSDIVVRLESELPSSLPPGRGTAVFCYGSCFHRGEAVGGLTLLVDGTRHRPAAWGMPRPDVYRLSPGPHSFRSGFWGIVTVPADARGAVELALAARLASGAEVVAPLGRIEVEPAPARALGGASAAASIAICMATFEPDMALFRAQVESLRAQTDARWICVISDDCSAPGRFAEIEALVGEDARFALSRSERRLGFYRNFERALRLAPADAELLALCDQDDRWHPRKLELLRAALGSATMVYSDQRLVDADGSVLRETLWEGRSNNHTDLTSMLVANSITGAATLFRRDVAELALPFPDSPGLPFHDHWLGLVALAAGDVAYVDRPLYDYVQHPGAFFGAVTHAEGERRARRLRGVLRGGRGAYFRGYVPRAVLAQVLLVRCAGRIAPAKRRALRRFIAAERSPLAFAWLSARPLRALAGRDETLGSESELVKGIVWRWLAAVLALGARAPGRRPADASLPDMLSFQQKRLRRWRARV
jgi:glycosyltransferase involved in cell wall biosynthesis